MKGRERLLNAVTYVGLIVLTLGILTFMAGLIVNGFSILVPVGIGTSVGAVFIFLIGVFLVVTDEMLEKSYIGTKVVPLKSKKGAPIQ
ncbi:hypothetical protein F4694_003448 [Bacillus niacini]|uniref:Uncharacterized protein n=2 Tax=Neobacillus TaxID=2675232 RepID=A0A852THB9_9BACI|nr:MULTISPECIES: hypothetical protein [Neobacillus]MDP5193824.1 hypothetical protein [Neobacillus sp. 179.-C4.2 HS]NYE06668.1 hypothetical protein [Neobacillus niacini]